MASTIKVDNVQNQPGTNVVNKCGTTVNIGAASDNIRSAGNNLQASDGGNLISQSGTTVTLGASGDTVSLASGASQSGFGRAGSVDWQTGSIKTGTFTAVTGEGYFVNTAAAISTVNLPAGVAGSIVAISDYTRTFNTYNCTVAPNGAEKMGGVAASLALTVNGQSATFVYVDGTEGWINVQETQTSQAGTPPFILATGGDAITTCGDYKTHIFTGPGTFCVSNLAPTAPLNVADYFVIAAGGGGGTFTSSSGAGAGGFRMSNALALPAPTTSPLASPTGVTVSLTGYPITVGAGGAGVAGCAYSANGNTSVFDSITSTGGGGGVNTPNNVGVAGGSGSGGKGGAGPSVSNPNAGGAGNTPATPISQGFPGGGGYDGLTFNTQGGGGGGAAAVGGNAGPGAGAPGGAGSFVADPFVGPTAPTYGTPGPTGSTRYFAGGGGGATDTPTANTYVGGAGGGGTAGGPTTPVAERKGTINTGGGGGAGYTPGGPICGIQTNGGSGIVMIRYKYQ